VANGKGGDLIRFLEEARIPQDEWPIILMKSSFCSAIRRGKGHGLLVWLEQNRVPREKWHFVLKNNSLFSAIVHGEPVDLARFGGSGEYR
jgi:hypothetical protein